MVSLSKKAEWKAWLLTVFKALSQQTRLPPSPFPTMSLPCPKVTVITSDIIAGYSDHRGLRKPKKPVGCILS